MGGAYVGAKGLTRGRSHAIRPYSPTMIGGVRGKRRGGERDSGDISGKIVELMSVIEVSVVVVEPRWRYHNF